MNVHVPISDMRLIAASLEIVIGEFENASANQDGAAAAIMTPVGKTELKAAMDEFETAWNDRRNKLKKQLIDLQDRITGISDGFDDGDLQMANSMNASLAPRTGATP